MKSTANNNTFHSVSIPGFGDIAYTDSGAGAVTLVFIHGLGSFRQVWEHNIPELKSGFRCIAPDLPGHGHSAREEGKYSIYYYAEVVAAFIREMKISTCVLVGHSMGGQIAVVVAVRYPVLVEKLVLVAPAGFEKFTSTEIQMMKNYWSMMDMANASSWQLSAGMKSNFHKWSAEAERFSGSMREMMDRGNRSQYMRMMQLSMWGMLDEPVIDILGQVHVPVLVMFGKNDALIPNPFLHSETTEELAKRAVLEIPDAKLIMLKDCGHYLQYEKPAEFNKALKAFAHS